MKKIIGTKIGMIQVLDVNGKQYPATVVKCYPNNVIGVKTKEKNKYNAVQIAYEVVTNKNTLNKPKAGIFTKLKIAPTKHIKELRDVTGYNVGDIIEPAIFTSGEYVDVQGVTKGHGFTGSIKRWNFKVGPLGHGAGYPHRYVGSVAFGRGGSQAQRVPKGKKLPGHYGHELVTIQNLVILGVSSRRSALIILGAIPGPEGSIVTISSSIKKPNKKFNIQIINKEIQEEILKANEKLEDKDSLHEMNEKIEEQEKKEAAAEEQAKKQAAAEKAKEAEQASIK